MKKDDPMYMKVKRLYSEENIPPSRQSEHDELVDAVKKFNKMYTLHETPDTEEIAMMRLETTGNPRNYGEERDALIKFYNELNRRLDEYFK
jgi:hypothetical protein